MRKIVLIFMVMWVGIVSAQITGAATNFNYGIKLPNATNEGDTLSFSTKIPIMDNVGGINYFANLSDLDGMFGATWGGITGTLSDQTDLQNALDLKLNSSEYTAADVLSKLLTVDGGSSGIDVQYLNGVQSSSFLRSDVDANKTAGNLRIYDNVNIRLGTTTISNFLTNGTNSYWELQSGNAIISDGPTPRFTFGRTTGNLTAAGTITATNFILSSDKRLKQNLQSLGNSYYSFEFKDKPGEKRYGVIAQEVKEYAPELVSMGEDGYLKVAYIDLLIKKQAEQEKRIKFLWIVIGLLSLGVGYSILKK